MHGLGKIMGKKWSIAFGKPSINLLEKQKENTYGWGSLTLQGCLVMWRYEWHGKLHCNSSQTK